MSRQIELLLRWDGSIKGKENSAVHCRYGDTLKFSFQKNREEGFEAKSLEVIAISDKSSQKVYEIDQKTLTCEVPVDEYPILRYKLNVVRGESQSEASSTDVRTLIVHPQDSPYFFYEGENKVQGLDNYEKRQNLNMITILPNLMPAEIKEWKPFLEDLVERGYNCFHIGPIHQVGISNSVYSINDHRAIDKRFGSGAYEEFDKLFNHFRKTYGSRFLIDIVLNHCSVCSDWIREKGQDSLFSLENAPQLKPAFELDQKLQKLTDEIMEHIFYNNRYAKIENHQQIDQMMGMVWNCINGLRLGEYFIIELDKAKETLKGSIKKDVSEDLSVQKQNIELVGYGCERFGTSLKIKEGSFVQEGAIESFVDEHNHREMEKVHKIQESISFNLKNFLIWQVKRADRTVLQDEHNRRIFPKYFCEVKEGLYGLHNGWVMDSSKDTNLLCTEKQYLLKREMNPWEDTIKFNFTKLDKDVELQKYMRKYLGDSLKLFDGIRLDNYHNTAKEIINFCLEEISKSGTQPLILAELFIGDRTQQIQYRNYLGVHYIVKEMWHYMEPKNLDFIWKKKDHGFVGEIWFDQTHDNPTYKSLNRVDLVLPFVSHQYAKRADVGSTLGYDEIAESQFHTNESGRKYELVSKEQQQPKRVDHLSWGHFEKTSEYVDRVFYFVKQNWMNFDSVYLKGSWDNWNHGTYMNSLKHFEKQVYWCKRHVKVGDHEYKFVTDKGEWLQEPTDSNKGGDFANNSLGVDNVEFQLNDALFLKKYFNKLWIKDSVEESIVDEYQSVLDWNNHLYTRLYQEGDSFTTKQVLVRSGETGLIPTIPVLGDITEFKVFYNNPRRFEDAGFPRILYSESIRKFGFVHNNELHLVNLPIDCTVVVVSKSVTGYSLPHEKKVVDLKFKDILKLQDINYWLYSCFKEEARSSNGRKPYFIPEYGQLEYAGLASFWKALSCDYGQDAIKKNLSEGPWMVDYCLSRFNERPLPGLSGEIKEMHKFLVEVPKVLRYHFFSSWVNLVYNKIKETFFGSMGLSAKQLESDFVQRLLISAPQFFSDGTLSAGLPHFSEGIWKEWGRDTFLSVPGFTIATRQQEKAKEVILDWATKLDHGLIPNLKAGPRYNCRDAVWFYLRTIEEYLKKFEDYSILEEKVVIRDKDYPEPVTLLFAMNLIFVKHAQGIDFVEEGAPNIDDHMSDKGFHITLKLDMKTKFIKGGNNFNCLTWMDKMGSGYQTKGTPGSSRTGSPIELTALMYKALRMMDDLNVKGHSEYSEVEVNESETLTFKDWADEIIQNFDNEYFNEELGIYRDTVGSLNKKEEDRLRPNALIATDLLFEQINKQSLERFIRNVDRYLFGGLESLGPKTLWNKDKSYRPDYDNHYHGQDALRENGINYHNGPEWVWPFGFYLKNIIKLNELKKVEELMPYLQNHKSHIKNSRWLSLPELTNNNGYHCPDSCEAQAWSTATILEAILGLEESQ